jgi:hypothetical protein
VALCHVTRLHGLDTRVVGSLYRGVSKEDSVTRKLSILLVVLVALLACKKAEFKTFTSQDGGFSVLMPGEPKEESKTTQTASGPIQFKMFSVELGSGSIAYIVAYNDYPQALIDRSNPATILDGAMEGAAGGSKSNITSKTDVLLGGHPGREFTAKLAGGFDYASRVFLVKERLYQVNVVCEPGKVSADDKRKFFESFKLAR